MEAALFQQMTCQEPNTDPDPSSVAPMLAGASLQRYTAAAERSYYKAKRELERERAANAKPAPIPVPHPAQVTRPVPNERKLPMRPPALSTQPTRNPNAALTDIWAKSPRITPHSDRRTKPNKRPKEWGCRASPGRFAERP
jgi:hypothetical protein